MAMARAQAKIKVTGQAGILLGEAEAYLSLKT